MTPSFIHVRGSTYIYQCRHCNLEVHRNAPMPVENIHHKCGVISRGQLPPTVTERLDTRYEILAGSSILRPREETDANLAKCETNHCGRFELNNFLGHRVCKRFGIGCTPLERWLDMLIDTRKWCEHWGPKSRKA